MIESNDLIEHRMLIGVCLRHRVPFFWRSPGTMLIRIAGASVVLQEIMDNGYKILGLEGFYLEGNLVLPQLDMIYDIGRDELGPIETLETWPQDGWVDVTIRLADSTN